LLGYQGTLVGWRGRSRGPFLVIDTGGSSHQVSWGSRRVVSQAGSTQIGSNVVAETILVDERGRPLDAMTAADLARADRRMVEAVPALPEGVTPPAGATPILTGDVSRYLSYYFGKQRVTVAEVAALRARMAAVPEAERALLARADVHGRPFTPREKDRLGLHDTKASGDDYGGKLPAKLTLLLRVMTLTNTQALHLSKTDARNALLR
jgi:hypothetical protein